MYNNYAEYSQLQKIGQPCHLNLLTMQKLVKTLNNPKEPVFYEIDKIHISQCVGFRINWGGNYRLNGEDVLSAALDIGWVVDHWAADGINAIAGPWDQRCFNK